MVAVVALGGAIMLYMFVEDVLFNTNYKEYGEYYE